MGQFGCSRGKYCENLVFHVDVRCVGGDGFPGYDKLNQNSEKDKESRLLSLFQCLEALSKDKKCTGGRQHDLLFLLNGVYPELQQDGSCKVVLLIEDMNSFLLERASFYLSEAGKKLLPADLFIMTREWAKYQSDKTDMVMFPGCVSNWLTSEKDKMNSVFLTMRAQNRCIFHDFLCSHC